MKKIYYEDLYKEPLHQTILEYFLMALFAGMIFGIPYLIEKDISNKVKNGTYKLHCQMQYYAKVQSFFGGKIFVGNTIEEANKYANGQIIIPIERCVVLDEKGSKISAF